MIDPPIVTDSPACKTAIVLLTATRDQLPRLIDAAIGEVSSVLEAQDIRPAGPYFSHYLNVTSTTFDLEVGAAVGQEVEPNGRVTRGVLHKTRIARTMYIGPHEGLHDAWATFRAWLDKAQLRTASHAWESYLCGPHSSNDSAKFRTELVQPLQSE